MKGVCLITTKEKEDYISILLLRNAPFLNEISKVEKLKEFAPKTLFKFRKFDRFTFDMIDNNYVFLANAKNLDDPFDCLTTIDAENIFDRNNYKLTGEMLDFVIDTLSRPFVFEKTLSKEEIGNFIYPCIRDGWIDEDKLMLQCISYADITEHQKNYLSSVFSGYSSLLNDLSNNSYFTETVKEFVYAKENAKVCSFATQRDNKVMWSLYANAYKGYCVEYEIPTTDEEVMGILLPVIYKRKKNFNVIRAIAQFVLEIAIRNTTSAYMHTNLACLTELLCSKDVDWEYQDEWRLLSLNSNRFNKLKIKAIYLGFDVTKRNELRIIKRAKKLNFKVYKMNPPSGSNELTYRSII